MARGHPRPTPQDHKPVSYHEARSRLLLAYKDARDVEWLVEVGRYVQDRWLAVENATTGDPLDDDAERKIWDAITEKELTSIRGDALVQLKQYVADNWRDAAVNYTRRTFKPISGFVRVLGWIGFEMLRGFVGAIGLILIGLLILWLAPGAAEAVRDGLGELLPRK